MKNVAVIGGQWGDEGKGKIVDWLSEQADVIVRFQGGHNAGHTLVIDGKVYKLHLLPSGVVRNNKISIIGNGVVINATALFKEIETVREQGVNITPENLYIADNACLILPLHEEADKLAEGYLGGAKIGTTGRGIGPAYEDKIGRRAIRIADLADDTILKERVENLLVHHNALRRGFGREELEFATVYDYLKEVAEKITPFAKPVWKLLGEFQDQGKKILFEGAQGILLDVEHGTYPYVTSSNTVVANALTGTGLGKSTINTLGIVKAYTTRVGEGPFPTELECATGIKLGERGHEFGTTTGRKRRCGWFDSVIVKQSLTVSGADKIALTKLDVLDDFEEIKICTGYEINGKKFDYLPASISAQAQATPIYESHKGWMTNTVGTQHFDDLPELAKTYIKRVEELINVPVTLVSTSPERKDTIEVASVFA